MKDKLIVLLVLIVIFGPVIYSTFKREMEKKRVRDNFFRLEEESKYKESAK